MKTALMLSAAVLAGLFAFGSGAAKAQTSNLCDLATPVPGQAASDSNGYWVFKSLASGTYDLQGHIEVSIANPREAEVRAAVLRVCDGIAGCSFPSSRSPASPMVLAAANSPATAVCADADGDGVAGLVTAQFAAGDAQTGDEVQVTVLSIAGDIDDAAPHPVAIVIGGTTYTGWSAFYRSF